MTSHDPPLPPLPADLIAFLVAGRSLPDPNSTRERLSIAFRPLAELNVERLEVDPGGWDYFTESDFEPDPGPKLVPAVRLATLGEADYGPTRFLVWLPDAQRFGVWDSADHCLQAFDQRTPWTQIASQPRRYLNLGPAGELRGRPCVLREQLSLRHPGETRPTFTCSLRQLSRTRPRDRAFIIAVVLGIAVIGHLCTTSPPPAISPETFDRIAIGMSEREVHRIVGSWPGYYDGYQEFFYQGLPDWKEPFGPIIREIGTSADRSVVWASRNGVLTVYFDEAGRVCGKRIVHLPPGRLSRPGNWPSWQRLLERESPADKPTLIYIQF